MVFLNNAEIFLVTADVSSLYTIIQHDDALLILNWAFCKRDDLPFIQKKFLRMVSDFCLTHNYFWYAGKFDNQRRGVAMGAKFGRSLANLFMSEWEDKWIFGNRRKKIIFYQRYIDDLFFIWQGSKSSLIEFSNWLNTNTNNIKLEFCWNNEHIIFLDVTVMKYENLLLTKAFFKATDRKSYIPVHSGHHPLWLRNNPKGQFMRICRNCSRDEDYFAQAQQIKSRFTEKGYNVHDLDKVIHEVGLAPQEWCLQPRESIRIRNIIGGFIGSFHEQYKDIKSIFRTQWDILRMDRILSKALPETPPFIYRRTASFSDKVVKKVLDPPSRPQMFWDRAAFYACRKYKVCQQVDTHIRGLSSFRSTANSAEFQIKEFISCVSTHVVYALECPCGLMYIGRTKRTLSKRVSEHIYNILIGYRDHSVSLHFRYTVNMTGGCVAWRATRMAAH